MPYIWGYWQAKPQYMPVLQASNIIKEVLQNDKGFRQFIIQGFS
jgi:hypothetical protein